MKICSKNLDDQNIWYPFTQAKTAYKPLTIVKGDGAYLIDKDNNSYLDLISSWWVNIHGHSNKHIANAITKQAQTLEHTIFATCTHSPAINLCQKLHSIMPSHLKKFFFSDNGSTACEVAIKMALQYWQNLGQTNRINLISFSGGYHGDTFGAMSMGKDSGFFTPFNKFLFNVFSIPFADTNLHEDEETIEKKENDSITILKNYLQQNGKNVAAFMAEPLVLGAGGMRMCRSSYLNKIIQLLKKYEIIVIFDEVMTGFGRTGTYFACEQIEEKPDIICLSKGLTGGFLPLALTVTTQKIYDAFLHEDNSKAFLHGHSYTGNPIACSAAIASFDLLTNPRTKENLNLIHDCHKNFLEMLLSSLSRIVKAPRIIGTIVAFNLFDEENNYNYKKTNYLKQKFIENGLIVRPLGNSIYLLPPYCITKDQLYFAYNKIINILKELFT